MGTLRRATVIAAVLLHTTGATILSFDEAKFLRVDAILVLGGGAPPRPTPSYPSSPRGAKGRGALEGGGQETEDPDAVGGHGHVPQLLDARGSVVFEATASAAVIINEGVISGGRLRRDDVVRHDRQRLLLAERPLLAGGLETTPRHHERVPPRPHEGDLRLGLRGRRRGAVGGLRALLILAPRTRA